MQIIESTTNRAVELNTLHAELAAAKLRLSHADAEGKRIIRYQIWQIERDIWRNRANLREKI